MEPKHRDILQKALPEIRRDLRVIHVVPKLIKRGILLKSMEQEVTNRELTHEDRADELIGLLQTRGRNAFPVFCEILQETYPHLADLLQKEDSNVGFVPAPSVYSHSSASSSKGPSLFIIHAGEDKKSFVRPLHRALLGQNLHEEEIFFDEVSISAGENISEKIMSTLASESLKLVTIVMSNHLLDKYWPRLEYEKSLFHQKNFYPIWLDQNTDKFEAFSRKVGSRFPMLKKTLAHRIQYDDVAEEITDVAVKIVQLLSDQCHPGTKRKRQTSLQSRQNVGKIKELTQEEMSSGGTDLDTSWTMPELKARIELIINSQELTPEAAGRIAEIERTLFTPEVLKDPQVYSQVFRTFLGHCAVILKTTVGSLLLILSFFRVSDVDKFYHTYSRLEPGSLSAELSKVLVSKHLTSIISEEQLTVRIHVEHEDYITIRNRLQKGLERSVSLDSLPCSVKPDKTLDTSPSKCLDALDLALAPGCYDKTWDSDMTKLLQQSVQKRRQLKAKLEIANHQASEKAAECFELKMQVRYLVDDKESLQDKFIKTKEQRANEKETYLLLVENLEKDKKSMQERAETLESRMVKLENSLEMANHQAATERNSLKELQKTKEQMTNELKQKQEYVETLESQILKLKNRLALVEDTDLEEPSVPSHLTRDELGKALLEAFTPLLKETVIPSNIVVHLMGYFDNGLAFVRTVIADEQNKGPNEAMEALLVKLQTCEHPGWFQAFLDALANSGYSYIKNIIEGRDTIQEMTGLKRLLQLWAPQLQVVRAMEMLPHLPCLSDQDKEQIEADNRNHGNSRALITLIDRVTRPGQGSAGYTQFLEGLRRNMYGNLADQLEGIQTGCEEITPLQAAKLPPEPGLKAIPMCSYQMELAIPALEGRNTIICAPTGSGKTRVAIKITREHLEGSTVKEGAGVDTQRRVVFLVNKVPLVEQQYNAFLEYLSPKYDILPLSGETAADIPVGETLPEHDVIILTAQVLENALRDGLITLDTFSMLIFDECHHCQKNDPYNAIMTRYIKQKWEEKSGTRLPQIIGLTASLSVGKAKSLKDAVEHILKACANLDAEWISQVVEHKEELMAYNQKTDEEVKAVSGRSKDPFANMINKIMEDIEKTLAIQASKHLTPEDLKPPRQREKQPYEQWVVTLARKGATLKDDPTSRVIHAATNHLRKYTDALAINADARTKDALQYLDRFVAGLQREGFDSTDEDLVKHFTEAKGELQAYAADPKYSNPRLDQLKYMILQAYGEKPDSRSLLFCKTRALTIALLTWMQEDEALRKLNPGRLVGAGASESTGGMTQNQQVELLELFTTGGHKIVISTSMAEEGIDIAKCNFVFRYDYVGNEIGKVQTRGRGRAEGSKSVLIAGTEGGNVLKEKLNTIREKLMEKAMLEVWHMQREKHGDFMKEVRRLQLESKKERDLTQALKELERKTKKVRGKGMKLLCVKCKVFACNVSDFRKIKENHHVVVDKTFPKRIIIRPHPPKKIDDWEMNGKIYCRNCRQDWGIQMVYRNTSFPTLKIESFILEKPDGMRLICRKWKKAPFEVDDITPDDISGMLETTEEEEESEDEEEELMMY